MYEISVKSAKLGHLLRIGRLLPLFLAKKGAALIPNLTIRPITCLASPTSNHGGYAGSSRGPIRRTLVATLDISSLSPILKHSLEDSTSLWYTGIGG